MDSTGLGDGIAGGTTLWNAAAALYREGNEGETVEGSVEKIEGKVEKKIGASVDGNRRPHATIGPRISDAIPEL